MTMSIIPDNIKKHFEQSSDEALVARYKGGDSAALNSLIERHKDLLNMKTRAYSNIPIPGAAVRGHSMTILADAAKAFNPGEGVQFRTFLDRYLRGLNRYVHRHKGALHFPDAKGLMLSKYQEFVADYTRRTGGPPQDYIVADTLGWSMKDTEQVRLQLSRKEYAQSGLENVTSREDNEQSLVDYREHIAELVYHGLDQKYKDVYDYALGRHGKPRIGTDAEIAIKMGLTLSMVNRIRKDIAKQINKHTR